MRVTDEVKSFLEAASFAVVCVTAELESRNETVVLVKSSRDLIDSLRSAGARVEVGFVDERTDRGPVLCLVLRAAGSGSGDLVGETYFDPTDEADARLFEQLGAQEILRVAFLDENMDLCWAAEVPWPELRRLEAAQVWDQAEGWLEDVESYDLEAAKELFQNSSGLDRLLERAFPPETETGAPS